MSLIVIRHNQRETRVKYEDIETLRHTDPKRKSLGVIRLRSGHEVLCSDMPYAIAQVEAVYATAAAQQPRSLLELIVGK